LGRKVSRSGRSKLENHQILQIINGETEHNASAKNKAGSNAVTTHSDTKRNIPGDSLSPLLFCIAFIPLTNELNKTDCGYQVHGTEMKISHLLYMDDLKLLSRSEEDLEKEITIVKANSKDITMNFGLEKGRIQRKTYIEITCEDMKELDRRKVCK
jgi:hypothetical protein